MLLNHWSIELMGRKQREEGARAAKREDEMWGRGGRVLTRGRVFMNHSTSRVHTFSQQ